MSKEKRPISEYWQLVIAAITPIIVSVSLTGFIGWLYRDQLFPKPTTVDRPSVLTIYTPLVETAEVPPTVTSTPPPEYVSHTPAHLFFINGQYLICNPVTHTAISSYASLKEYGEPMPPYQIIINDELYEPTSLGDELFSLMGERDFSCLPQDNQ